MTHPASKTLRQEELNQNAESCNGFSCELRKQCTPNDSTPQLPLNAEIDDTTATANCNNETASINSDGPCISSKMHTTDDFCQKITKVGEARTPEQQEMMRKAQMNISWYDTYIAMHNRHRHHVESKELNESLDKDMTDAKYVNANILTEVEEMTKIYSFNELRDKLTLVQQQLFSYHSLLDDIEKSKSYATELEKEVAKLKSDRVEQTRRMKKLALCYKKAKTNMRAMEDELIQLKVEIAQSKTQEDHNIAKINKISTNNKRLEQENEVLLREKMSSLGADQMHSI
mmetsp:Transcript_2547/g.3449  ORF Transcript_2547/g.3449 Transcript_2547/m.3449 type:complete len:287 (-) Transcript_2547:324-1184(-)